MFRWSVNGLRYNDQHKQINISTKPNESMYMFDVTQQCTDFVTSLKKEFQLQFNTQDRTYWIKKIIKPPPKIAVFHLKFRVNQKKLIQTSIQINQIINIPELIHQYNLYSIVLYKSHTTDGNQGHYATITKINKKWYLLDDHPGSFHNNKHITEIQFYSAKWSKIIFTHSTLLFYSQNPSDKPNINKHSLDSPTDPNPTKKHKTHTYSTPHIPSSTNEPTISIPVNPHTQCYLNAIINSFTHTPKFTTILNNTKLNKFILPRELNLIFDQLKLGKSPSTVIITTLLKFKPKVQQDCGVALHRLLTALQSIQPIHNMFNWPINGLRYNIHKVVINTTPNPNESTYMFDVTQESIDFVTSLKREFELQFNTQDQTFWTKKIINSPPEIAIFQLKFRVKQRKLVQNSIRINQIINIPQLIHQYDLYSIVLYKSHTTDGTHGHYATITKINNKWYLLDDHPGRFNNKNYITEIQFHSAQWSKIIFTYSTILFYSRKNIIIGIQPNLNNNSPTDPTTNTPTLHTNLNLNNYTPTISVPKKSNTHGYIYTLIKSLKYTPGFTTTIHQAMNPKYPLLVELNKIFLELDTLIFPNTTQIITLLGFSPTISQGVFVALQQLLRQLRDNCNCKPIHEMFYWNVQKLMYDEKVKLFTSSSIANESIYALDIDNYIHDLPTSIRNEFVLKPLSDDPLTKKQLKGTPPRNAIFHLKFRTKPKRISIHIPLTFKLSELHDYTYNLYNIILYKPSTHNTSPDHYATVTNIDDKWYLLDDTPGTFYNSKKITPINFYHSKWHKLIEIYSTFLFYNTDDK